MSFHGKLRASMLIKPSPEETSELARHAETFAISGDSHATVNRGGSGRVAKSLEQELDNLRAAPELVANRCRRCSPGLAARH